MQALAWPSIGWYCLFSLFTFYQQLHVRNVQGSGRGFGALLTISAFCGLVTSFAYLVYYGWTVAWWAPFVIFVISLPMMLVGALIEHLVGALAVSLCGFIAWPVCAYFMFSQVPRGA